MTWSQVLALLGLLLSLGGSILAAIAFREEWRTHRPGVPMVPVRALVRRLFGRSRSATVYGTLDAVLPNVTISGVAVAFRADETTEQRLERLAEEVAALGRSTAERFATLDRAHGETVDRLETLAGDVETIKESVREVATGTVRLELVGLFLVALGAVVAAVPTVCDW